MIRKSLRPSTFQQPTGDYVSVLLEMGIIESPGYYSHEQISQFIRENQEAFDTVYHDLQLREQVRYSHTLRAEKVFVINKEFTGRSLL